MWTGHHINKEYREQNYAHILKHETYKTYSQEKQYA